MLFFSHDDEATPSTKDPFYIRFFHRYFPAVLLVFIVLVQSDPLWAQGPPGKKGPPPSPVRVAPVIEQEIAESITLVGTTEPRTRSLVASETAGLVEQFPVEEGDSVKKGQLLTKLRTDTLELDLKTAQASLREIQARHEQAKRQIARTEPLFQQGLATQKQYQDELSDEEAFRQKLDQLNTEILQIQNNIDKSRIVSPFSGQVVNVFTEIGQWISQGGPVAEVVDLNHVRIEVPVPERFVDRVKVGDSVIVTFDAVPNFPTEGKILFVVAQADEASRTFPAKVDLKNPDQRLKSGMMARVSLAVGTPIFSKVVPKDALVIRGGRYQIFVLNGDTVSPYEVQVGTMVNNLAAIQGPVKVGQQVVTHGNERLRPGQSVRVTE